MTSLRLHFFGSSLLSSLWNGAATYYRGILRCLSDRGVAITFWEPRAFGRQDHCDLSACSWCDIRVYQPEEDSVYRCLESALEADLIIKASGVGVFDELLEAEISRMGSYRRQVAFWDVDAPATLERMLADPQDPLRLTLPRWDHVFTYGGGEPVIRDYERLGARSCVPIYNALDPTTHFRVSPSPSLQCDLCFLGNRLPDRERRVHDFFFRTATAAPHRSLLLGGSGWEPGAVPPNVRLLGHVGTALHNALNSSAWAVLNISRDSMARYGFSPATRVFECAGAAACLITDAWEGIELFFDPGQEILVAHDSQEVADHLGSLTPERRSRIGVKALRRALAEHTYDHRAEQWQRATDFTRIGVSA